MAFDTNDLSPHEHHVVERTREGEVADFSALTGGDGAKPVVRAGFLRKLLLRMDPAWPVQAPGVRIKGARIEGALDLSDCAGGAGLPALALAACEIPGAIDVSHTKLARLSIEASKLRQLVALETIIDGEFCFAEAAPLEGDDGARLVMNMAALRVGGNVRGDGARIGGEGVDGASLNMHGARIGGDLFLRSSQIQGRVWLRDAEIARNFDLSRAQLTNRSGDSAEAATIIADNLRVKGDALLRDGMRAEGKVDLVGARISGDLDCEGSIFKNEGSIAIRLANAEIGGNLRLSAKVTGHLFLHNALIGGVLLLRGLETSPGNVIAPALRVSGSTHFDGANIKGELMLSDARIDGRVVFAGGRIINDGAWAIRATNMRVGGNLSFNIEDSGFTPFGQKTVIEGGASFARARIEGAFSWQNLELRGKAPQGAPLFSFADSAIAGPLEARALTTHQDASIDASGAACAALDDDVKTGWGTETTRLNLEGFSYGRIDNAKEHWRQRLAWLKRARGDDGRFSPQPFGQAAQVYARAGKRESARRILLAQHDLRAVAGAQGPVTWLLSSLFGLVSGYGLAPIRVVRALALFLAIGVAGVLTMNAQGALVTPQGRQCNGAIEPAIYAIDVALPLIDLGQQSACAPGRTARADLPHGVAINANSDWRVFEGLALWRWAHALYAIFGAILAALAVLTFSGVMKPRDN